MAPDSKLCRHLLGEAATGLQRSVLKATVPVCLFLSLSVPNLEARTEPGLDSWSHISASFLAHERQLYEDSTRLASLIPPMSSVNSSPVGRWSNRIQIPIPNHPSVQKYIRFFDGPGRVTFEKSLERAGSYAPIMAEILESLHVPAEMLAIVLIESNFKGKASHRGAGGYWQMLASTARTMGLRVDRWVDERRDPIKSTQAAARYLYSFHERFGSWPLAIAAYNLGDGPVVGAVRRHGTSDFWELCERGALPRTTRAYVPKVMAAIHIMRDLNNYGFGDSETASIYDFEPIKVQAPLKLDQIANWLDVPVDSMRELNPSLRSDRVPPDSDFALRLPSGARDRFDLAYEDYLRK